MAVVSHLCLRSGSSSALDLANCSTRIAVHLKWYILEDLYGSDRYPISLCISARTPLESWYPNSVIRCADWKAVSWSVSFEDWEFPSVDSMVEHLMSILHWPASSSIPLDHGAHPSLGRQMNVAAQSVHGSVLLSCLTSTLQWRIWLLQSASALRPSMACVKPSAHHGRPWFLVSLGLPILVLSGKMSGGYNCISIPGISVGGNAITSQVYIVNTLGANFTSVFCSNSYDPSFKLLKETTNTLRLNFASWLTELCMMQSFTWMNCL
jgi:hypothetical protein